MSKATLRQLLIVVCLSSVVSHVTPVPPLQELTHRDKDLGGAASRCLPPPRDCRLPRPPVWLLLLSPPRCSCHAEPQRSATWLTINAARCGAKSSPSEGALTGAARDLAAHHAVGSQREWRWAAELGAGAGARVLWRGHRRHCTGHNTPALPPAGRQESQTRTCTGKRHGSATTGASRA